MARKAKLILGAVLAVLIIAAIGGSYWYFACYTKTPEYAVRMIGESFERHDTVTFNKYVATDELLSTAYDDMLAGMVDAGPSVSLEAKAVMDDFARIMKTPLVASCKTALNDYVANGYWPTVDENDPNAATIDVGEVLDKAGVNGINFRSVDGITTDEATGTAVAAVRVYQKEADREFVFAIQLLKNADGVWQAVKIKNFHDFIMFISEVRHSELAQYVSTTSDIIAKHNKAMLEADKKLSSLLANGSLGSNITRDKIKSLMLDTIKSDWQTRRDELAAVAVPDDAEALQRLRLQICDLHISYADTYAAWMSDKKAETLKEAESKLKQAITLEQEEKFLAKRLNANDKPM